MLFNYASNAITAKAHAMYGKRLTNDDYQHLLSMKSVGEIAVYLKNNTSYAKVLDTSAISTMHRTQLELLLRLHLFNQYEALTRYEEVSGKKMKSYFILSTDIEEILFAVRLLTSNDTPDDILFTSNFFSSHTHLDVEKFIEVKNINELLNLLKDTPYYTIVKPYLASDKVLFLELERALYRYLYSELGKTIEKQYKGKEQKELSQMIGMFLDMQIITSIYRMKTFFYTPSEEIQASLYTPLSTLSKKQIQQMIQAENTAEVMAVIETTSYGKMFKEKTFTHIEDVTHRILYENALHAFRYSTLPTVVMFAYFFIAQIELDNLIHIIEGVRYGINSGKIESILIGISEERK